MNKTSALDGLEGLLSYPFKSSGWQSKFVIGTALWFANYIIPILPSLLVLGYFAGIMRGVILDGSAPELPEWQDWGKLLSRGFKVFAATLIYMLPAVLLLIGGYLIAYVPFFFVTISTNGSYNPGNSLLGFEVLAFIVGIFMMVIGFVLYLPLIVILPPAITHLIAKDSFAAAFRIREWWAILRANAWGFFAAAAFLVGVYSLLLFVSYLFYFTVILCFLFPLVLGVIMMYLSVVAAPVLGEAYRKGAQIVSEKQQATSSAA